MAELVIWSGGQWRVCPADEITWLDRRLLSGGRDATLHRSPRCPALRHVHYRWELFSRDTSHSVYVAPFAGGSAPDYQAVQAAAAHMLPQARGALEPQPLLLDGGAWLIGVGKWVLPVQVRVTPGDLDPAAGHGEDPGVTHDIDRRLLSVDGHRPPAADAVPRVTRYFQRNPTACLAMAYYYQDFIHGALAPQPRPMDSVAVALDLNKGAVSEYKKELQRRIWDEQGHQRELGEFLLENGLISEADLRRALALAAANEAAGRTAIAQERLRYARK
jgi:hypothetical protein